MAKRRSPVSADVVEPESCTPDVRRHLLAHVPLFSGLEPDAIAEVDRRCQVEDFQPGEAVHLAGEPARSLHVIVMGTAKLVRPSLDGTEVLIDVLRSGDHFGALPALGASTYPDSVWPLTPLCVLRLGTEAFDEILEQHPGVARAGLDVLTRRLEQAMSQIHAMAAATAEQRIAAALVMLVERTGRPHGGGATLIDVPLSRDDLARLTGTASETASRILAQLRRDGVIDTGRRWVAVRDLDALEALAVI